MFKYYNTQIIENAITTETSEGNLKSYQAKYKNEAIKPSYCTNKLYLRYYQCLKLLFYRNGDESSVNCSFYEYYEVATNLVNGGKITSFINEITAKGKVVDCSLCNSITQFII